MLETHLGHTLQRGGGGGYREGAQLNLGAAEVSRGDKEQGEFAATVRPHQKPQIHTRKFTWRCRCIQSEAQTEEGGKESYVVSVALRLLPRLCYLVWLPLFEWQEIKH